MRIAVHVGQFPAVSETFVIDQITSFLALGHDVVIVAGRPGRPPYSGEVAAHGLLERTRYRGRRSEGFLAHVARALTHHPARTLRSLGYGADGVTGRLISWADVWEQAGPVEAVVSHFGPLGAIACDLRRLGVFDTPIGVIFHGSDMQPQHRRRYGRMLREAEALLPNSAMYAQRLMEWGAAPERVHVQHNGIRLDRFPFAARHVPESGPLRVLTVARLVEFKGLRFAIEAVSMLAPTLRGRLVYEIIGDGPLRDSLAEDIRRLELSDVVRLRGALAHEEVREAMSGAHLFILPSITTASGRAEGMGVVLMEAMASGVPVIAANSGGIPELVKDGVNGWLVEERNARLITQTIERLIASPEEVLRVVNQARVWVEERHDLLHQAARIVAHLGGSGSTSPAPPLRCSAPDGSAPRRGPA